MTKTRLSPVTAVLLLLATLPAMAQEHSSTNGSVFVSSIHIEPSLSIPSAHVVIHHDGTIEYGEGYTPDAAAKALWDAVGVERKARNCQ